MLLDRGADLEATIDVRMRDIKAVSCASVERLAHPAMPHDAAMDLVLTKHRGVLSSPLDPPAVAALM